MTLFGWILAIFLGTAAVATGLHFVPISDQSHGSGGTYRGAPGPIAGAGLPILAVGYGVYWLIKRRRKAD
jgi:hypothetical protein